jgi:hypothetical protein
MKEQLVSFETAKLAKEKEFDWVCGTVYNDSKIILAFYPHECFDGYRPIDEVYDYYPLPDKDILYAPTQSLLQKWLRDVEGIDIDIVKYQFNTDKRYEYSVFFRGIYYSCSGYDSYEKCLEAALIEALNKIKA